MKTQKKFKLGRTSKKNLKGIDERLYSLVERTIAKSKIDFGIPEYGGLRTPQEQNNLFHRRPKVTNLDGFINKSYHQTGKAFDIFAYDGKKACWDCVENYEAIAKLFFEEFDLMKEEGIFKENEVLEWGGNWTRFRDLPHFQMVEK